MKKFLFFLIFVLLLGGTGFFLGWTQLTVPPGSYGVMRSKTHGLEAEVIKDGAFRWLWYKAIPTNAAVSVYTLGPVKRAVRNSGSLPSGEMYATLAGLDADFSWEISGEFEFSIRPDVLPEFTARENISGDSGLRDAEQSLAGRIENLILLRLKSYADNEETLESLLLANSHPELESEIQKQFPEIENLSCRIQVVRYPDFALYNSVKALYQDYLSRQNIILNQELLAEAESRIETRLRLDELNRYGELLTKYPVLLQYLTLEKELPPAP